MRVFHLRCLLKACGGGAGAEGGHGNARAAHFLCNSFTNVYAHTREECEEKLKVLIVEMKSEIAELKRQKVEGTLPPEPEKDKKESGKEAKKGN